MNEPHRIEVGKNTKTGEPAFFDVRQLILTRLLICANSGGGKSYLIRRLVELLCKLMPVVIFDPEGEFSSLREKFDFLLVGPGGETPADTRTAKIVMEKVLELRCSCIFDLSEMEKEQKDEFVKRAGEAAINAPKKFWRDTAFVFDEVHVFCPAGGKEKSVAKGAVMSFATRGRKRRFLSIFATQRLHKLANDARAEMLNRMVGMTFEPADLDEVAGLLGIRAGERDDFDKHMRTMEAGIFYTFGRAISMTTEIIKVGPVKTSHGIEEGKHGGFTPPATAKIKSLLPSLADLPAQAAAEERDILALQSQVRDLQQQLNTCRSKVPDPEKVRQAARIETKRVEVPVLSKREHADLIKLKKAVERLEGHAEKFVNSQDALYSETMNIVQASFELSRGIEAKLATPPQRGEASISGKATPSPIQRPASTLPPMAHTKPEHTGGYVTKPGVLSDPHARRDLPNMNYSANGPKVVNTNGTLGKGPREVLTAIAQHPDGVSDEQIAVLTGYKATSRGEFKRQLQAKGMIEKGGRGVTVTQAGRDALGPNFKPLPTGQALREYWMNNLTGGELQLFQYIVGHYPHEIPHEVLKEATGYKDTSVGEFRRQLVARDLIKVERGSAKANPLLF